MYHTAQHDYVSNLALNNVKIISLCKHPFHLSSNGVKVCDAVLLLLHSQVHQERLYQEYNFSKAEGHLKQMEKIYTQQIQSKDVELTSMKGEVTSMKKVLEEYKKKFSDISEKLMERNRQYQKLQGLYDSLRLRNITIASQEGSQEQATITQSGVFGFPLGKKGFDTQHLVFKL